MGSCCSTCSGYNSDEGHQEGYPASENVHLIKTNESWEARLSEAVKDGKIVVANFSASWCRPCIDIQPAYSELADKHPSIVFLTLDVDDLAELSTSWEIKATPTFLFLKDGRQVDKLIGSNKLELQKKTAALAHLATKSNS